MKIIFKFVFILLLLPFILAPPHTEATIVTGSGTNETQALHDAFAKAIEQRQGIVVQSHTLVENHQARLRAIYTNATGYIKNYKIIEPYNINTHSIKIDIDLLDTLDGDFISLISPAIVKTNLGDPWILINAPIRYQNQLINIFTQNGFSRVSTNCSNAQFIVNMSLDNPKANLATYPAARQCKAYTAEVPVHIIVYKSYTNEVIYDNTYIGRQWGIDALTATDIATQEALMELIPQINRTIKQVASNPINHIQIIDNNLTYKNIFNLNYIIKSIPNVQNTYVHSENTIDIDYSGPIDEFISMLNFCNIDQIVGGGNIVYISKK